MIHHMIHWENLITYYWIYIIIISKSSSNIKKIKLFKKNYNHDTFSDSLIDAQMPKY